MTESLILELPKILERGKKEAQKILDGISGNNKITLQTNELLLPTKAKAGLSSFFGQSVKELSMSESVNRMIYGDNLFVMQALIAGDPMTGMSSLKSKIDLIYIDPPFDSKADYRTKIHLPNIDIEQRPTVIEQFAYSDTWKNGTASYLEMIIPRLYLMRELLSEKGSIYVHLDWHVGHYVKIIMDEIFGRQNFKNEIVWYFYNKMQGNINRFATNHNVVFWYTKSSKYYFKRQYEKRPKKTKQLKRVWSKEKQSLINARDDNGNVIYIETDDKAIDDVWRMSMLQPADKKENLRFNTQKPEALIERVVQSSSRPDSIVADFFAGSGTLGAVAERLGRRWIMSDLGKPACMIMRKRLIDQDANPFFFQSVGDYQKEQFEKSSFRTLGDLAQVVINLYGALPFPAKEGVPANLGYIKQSKTLVFVDSPSKMTGYTTLKRAQGLRASFMGGWNKLVVLGWNFVTDIARVIEGIGDDKLEVLVIPPDLLDRLKSKVSYEQLIKSGKVRFSSLQYITIKAIQKKKQDEDNDLLEIELDNYILLSPDALPLDKENKEKLEQIIKKDPLGLIEYWSVDPNYDGRVFRSKWQDYRENNDNLKIKNTAKIIVPKMSVKTKVCVKAVDVFGFESATVREIK